MSTNRTLVSLFTVEPIARAEGAYLGLHASLLGSEPRELGLALRERTEEVGYERADRAALLGRPNPRASVDIVGNADRDVLHRSHSTTLSQKLW